MANRKTVEQQIAEAQEKIKQEQNALKKLQKKQTEQNTKARNHRLCKRHGFLESILPDLIDLTDEQYQKFVKQHIANSHGINALEKIKAQGATTTPPKPAEATAQPANTVTAKPPKTTSQPASPSSAKSPEATAQSNNPAPQKSARAEQKPKTNCTRRGNTQQQHPAEKQLT